MLVGVGKYWLNLALSRVFLPIVFTGCIVWRPCALSIIYLALMLYLPMVPIPSQKTMNGHTRRYLIVAMGLCFLAVVVQFIFQLVLIAMPPYAHFIEDCNYAETLLRHIGLVRLNEATAWIILFWLTPELVALPSVVVVYVVCRRLNHVNTDDEQERFVRRNESREKPSSKVIDFLGTVGTYVALLLLCCAGILEPSVEGGIYFLTFLGAGIVWAFNTDLRRGFAHVCRVIMFVVVIHLVFVLSYQTPWPQEYISNLGNHSFSRYFGLVDIYSSPNCSDSRDVEIVDQEWTSYNLPIQLIWLYYILALQSHFLIRKPAKKATRFSGKLENLDTPLSRHVSTRRRTPSQKWQSARRKARLMRFGSGRAGLLQDSTGSVIVQDGHRDDSIQMQSISDAAMEDQPGIVEHVVMAFYSIFQLIIRSSYLATNIVMMAWSITYHSWTTFVLLLWAIVLWMVPNKRSWMHKCSPFIVVYAMLLLIVQFIFNLNLNDDELPKTIYGIDLSQIGFTKTNELKSWHLLVKCLYTTMFWITMRQYMAERSQQIRTSALRDMVAPLHVSVSTATTAMNQDVPEIHSKFMETVGTLIKKVLTKFWIAIVAIMLFTSGITGERMTVFRIVYMSLFLVFVITFQISWFAWRRMMYGFWIAVIAYSVVMLILVYTYQFKDFPKYWSSIGIEQALQNDIGLEAYDTKDLFVRLLTPTFFVIITVVQMHYFHKDFLDITDIDKAGPATGDAPRDSDEQTTGIIPVASPTNVQLSDGEEEHHMIYTLKQLKQMSKLERIALFQRIVKHLYNFYNYVWLFLEIHMQKIIFTSMMLLCVKEVCMIHFFFVATIGMAMSFKRSIQIISIKVLTAVIATLMVIKMLYQINHIKHENWNVECNVTEFNVENPEEFHTTTYPYNIATWFGMDKAEPSALPNLLKGYIGIITVTTLRAIILVRQMFFRRSKGEPLETPTIMFAHVTRHHADNGIPQCLKFLFNYGFYKFGFEFCLFGIIFLIGTRLDFYSVLYAIWLAILYNLSRPTASKVWPVFQTFCVIFLPVQYFMVVAPPSWLCIDYPWHYTPLYKNLQEWMFLPDPVHPPDSRKLLCDFFLLLMVARQRLAFRIEANQERTNTEYPAGHNCGVFMDTEDRNFVNPVEDYVSQARTWLDVAKRSIFLSLMWISMSIMFLAGTKRTNLFSLGYLIGAFIFLWQGSDFYLRPIKTILRWWNMLITYNVTVIVSKAILQGVGCIFVNEKFIASKITESACWLVQLLGVACLKKFDGNSYDNTDATCQVPREDIGMVWDGLCFAFLLMQKRLFTSYYFFHIVDETKAMSILASRGAELLEEMHQKRIEKQESIEKATLEKLKFKMDKIKADQKKILGPDYVHPSTHLVDALYPGYRPLYRHRAPTTNREAVRSGDYYMFDDLDDDVTELTDDGEENDEFDRLRQQEERGRRMTLSELVNTVIKTDIEIATNVALYGGTHRDALQLRRRSEPMTRKKSSMSYLSARSETETAAPIDEKHDERSSDSTDGDAAERETKSQDLTKRTTPPSSDDENDTEVEETKKVSILTYLRFCWAFINSTMVSMTTYLNKFSRDYRYIRKVLTEEKRILKKKPDFRTGMRLGISQIWQPLTKTIPRSTPSRISEDRSEDSGESSDRPAQPRDREESLLTVPHIRILAPSLERGLDMSSSSSIVSPPINPDKVDRPTQLEDGDGTELSDRDHSPFIKLVASIWFAILAHSNLICYFMIFLYQIKNASVISLPLPMMVFLWGTLTIPRPSKTFWVTLIAYTEIIVIAKCMFQLELFPWNQKHYPNRWNFPPRILGIERKPNYALWDLLLLLIVFFHRLMLKSLGQWNISTIKQRKIIPTEATIEIVPRTLPSGDGDQMATDGQTASREENGQLRRRKHRGHRSSVPVEGGSGGSATSCDDSEGQSIVPNEDSDSHEEKLTETLGAKAKSYLEPIKTYFMDILNSDGKEKTNVYAYMFLCDFFNFLLIIFGFSAFGTQQGDGGVTAYLAENRVPMPFLLMLLLQFTLIVIDRALFLRKYILGKLVFQYILVIGIHLWMFFILPSVTERSFNEKLPPQIWYMVKCFYLLLAAYQLRLGYPTRILGNFLCKKYTLANYCGLKLFMFVPFLFELRAVMDWIWTDTSMTIMDWFKMEDIFSNIYQIKCMRGVENEYPQPRGIKKKQSSKYMVGGFAVFLIIGIIWFPLLLFALGGTVGVSNLPYEVSMKLRIGSYEPIYAMSAQNSTIIAYNQTEYERLQSKYSHDKSATTFLENYDHTDVAAVKLSASSRRLWAISPPDLKRLKMEINGTNVVTVHVEWSVSRETDAKDASDTTTTKRDIQLPPMTNRSIDSTRKTLLEMLTAIDNDDNSTIVALGKNKTEHYVTLLHAFPKFLKVTSKTTSVPLQLMHFLAPTDDDEEENPDFLYRNMTWKLSLDRSCCAQWWIVKEECINGTELKEDFKEIPQNSCDSIVMILFSDKAFPKELSFISGFGILGLYTTGVIVISQLLRRNVNEMAPKIMFEDLPYVDRILRLCLDIYLVRESGELCLEEDLFAKLIFLYRSPETLIRWTRPPEPGEQADDNDDDRDDV